MKKVLESPLSRRSLVMGAGAASAASIGVAMLFAPRRRTPSLGEIDEAEIAPIGDGFYLAGGWVLSEDDLRARGLTPPDEPAREARAD
ncbi:MAG TPA: hypothetical protein PLV61_11185 [Parvularculaceae bacterium]|jgi:hypothetical protein|nr:hypothetical protein [Amphiplicatus sp.]MCB9956262.1 hypothetical protein [Caulobacterales bacterium]HPE31744.1 hypothetical protein [Parvularculaceae bacterium]HRX39699.1 hypothetical protein [Parvularculaceae bacterium]